MTDDRKILKTAAEWVADYRDRVGDLPVFSAVSPGDVRKSLPPEPPERGEAFEAILADFDRKLVPALTHWNHPRFFGYFTANNSTPSIAAEILTAGIGAQCMSWQTSPAATELEQVVMDWLRQMLRLPPAFTGVIQDTASTATLVALLMAREKATEFRFKEEGASATGAARLRVYASEEAHSSVEKGVLLSGIGRDNLVKIPVDDAFAIQPGELRRAVARDRDRGLIPACVVATIGTTGSTAVDPLVEIGDICRKEKVFLHVDAAFAGSAAILPELRRILDGVENADTFVFNPHKWLYTNFDCTAFFVKDVESLLKTCGIQPEYLRTPYDSDVVNFRDWGLQLGRRFRALKLWFVIRSFGVEGLRQKIREGIRLAKIFRGWVESDPSFEILAPSPFSLVCFRYAPAGRPAEELDSSNEQLMNAVNRGGKAFLTHTKLGGRLSLRLNASQERTTERDLAETWMTIQDTARAVDA